MDWFLANSGMVFERAGQHLVLALVPMVLGLVISIPLAQFSRRHPALQVRSWPPSSSLLYTIPSLALFIILPPLLGTRILDPLNVIVALTIYAVALLVRAAMDAFDSVDDDLRQAAVAMGYKPAARFLQIDLPLSLPVMFAGLRVVSVSNISLVSVAALLGVGNLGMLFTDGLQRTFVTEVVVGIVAILLLALLMDARAGPPGAAAHAVDPGSAVTADAPTPVTGAEFIADANVHAGARLMSNIFTETFAWLADPEHWSGSSGIAARLLEHLQYSGLVLVIAAAIAVPVGLYIGHTGRGRVVAVAVAGALRALPTLGPAGALRPPRRQQPHAAGVGAGDPHGAAAAGRHLRRNLQRGPNVVDAARAMGMNELQILFRVELPNGLQVMFGGIRTAVLQVIATVSVVAYLPLGGLGRYLFDGLVLQDFPRMLAGSLLIAGLAIAVDLILAAVQRLLVSPGLSHRSQGRPQGRHRSHGCRARGGRCSRRHPMKHPIRTTLTRRGLGGLAAGVGIALRSVRLRRRRSADVPHHHRRRRHGRRLAGCRLR